MDTGKMKRIIEAAAGRRPVDLLLKNANLVNVFSGRLESVDVAVAEGFFVGFGKRQARRTVDLGGRFLAPGLIDAHVHMESSLTCPAEFARAVVPRGTAAVVADPHEIANVLGLAGIEYMLQASHGLALEVFLSLSSCVPATAMETCGARLEAEDLEPLLAGKRIVALAEMMNFPGVIAGDDEVLAKIAAARRSGKPVDGHGPGLSGRDLHAYLAAGIASDHECTTAVEAYEKLAAGMHIMIRQGTCARNLDQLVQVVDERTWPRTMLCTDDRHPHDLMDEGHMDAVVRRAIACGLAPVTAVQMATINVAEYFGLHRQGAVAPGRRADFVILDSLESFRVDQVYHGGRLVAEDGRMVAEPENQPGLNPGSPMNIDPTGLDFGIPAAGKKLRAIQVIADQVVTGSIIAEARIAHGQVVSDPGRDLIKLAVIERYRGTNAMGKAFVSGLGLKRGALASTVAHDSHNLVVTGVGDEDMLRAVTRLVEMGGGLVAVDRGKIMAELPLPVAGLMSDQPLEKVRRSLDGLLAAARSLGCSLDDPFMSLSFLALPVIPELKLTDKGLVDVGRFQLVSIFAD